MKKRNEIIFVQAQSGGFEAGNYARITIDDTRIYID